MLRPGRWVVQHLHLRCGLTECGRGGARSQGGDYGSLNFTQAHYALLALVVMLAAHGELRGLRIIGRKNLKR